MQRAASIDSSLLGRCRQYARQCALAIVVVGVAAAVQPAAAANPDAEKFTQSLIDRGFSILRDKSGGEAARKARFHEFVLQNVDAEKTSLFTLGQYRRNAPEADLAAFTAAFRDYATAVYEARLEERQAVQLKVVGSTDNKPGDVTVMSQADSGSGEPIKIGFRLLGSNGSYKVVDVQAAGIWLSIEQRDQFSTFLSKNNGDIKALTANLIQQTSRIRGAQS